MNLLKKFSSFFSKNKLFHSSLNYLYFFVIGVSLILAFVIVANFEKCYDENYIASKAKSLFTKPLPKLFIDIKHKDFIKLSKLRNSALKEGIISKDKKMWLSAKIRDENNNILKAKLRIKGDWTDHIFDQDKWSFRIKIKGDKFFNGLKVFSIQHPDTRTFLGEYFSSKLMQENEVLAPREFFYQVYINGESIGVMNLEEFFSKEMIEAQNRKESVLLKISEDFMWNCTRSVMPKTTPNTHDQWNSYCRHANNISAIESFNKYNDFPIYYKNSISLLRGYFENKISYDEVFDLDILANYFAIIQIIGSSHGSVLHNTRFYYNPITSKIELVSYDNQSPSSWDEDHFGEIRIEFLNEKLRDRKFYNKYIKAIDKITYDILYTHKYDYIYDEIIDYYYPFLKSEFSCLRPFDANGFKRRVELVRKFYLEDLNNNNNNLDRFQDFSNIDLSYFKKQINEENIIKLFDTAFFAYDIENNGLNLVEIKNFFKKNLTIRRIYAKKKKSKNIVEVKTNKKLPLKISSKTKILTYQKPKFDDYNLYIEAKIDNIDKIYTYKASKDYSFGTKTNFIPESSLKEQLKIHKFLTYKDGKLFVQEGNWIARNYLIVPKNTELIFGKATTISFKKDFGIISYSPLKINGLKNKKVVLQGYKKQKWKGIVVIKANGESTLKDVIIKDLTNMSDDRWSLTGGVTFYKSDVKMQNVEISDDICEDALNIVNSKFTLNNLTITNSVSDAFDSDFSSGDITNSFFENIGYQGGGDAIDFSGSKVNVDNVEFNKVFDKAISVGERSVVNVKNSKVINSNFGVVSKDSSNVYINHLTLENIKHASLMSYQKKPEYKGAKIIANNIIFKNVNDEAIVQKGSWIKLNDKYLDSKSLDVELLYQTKMKKLKRKLDEQ